MTIVQYKQQAFQLWIAYKWLIIVFVIAAMCDAASTVHFMLYDTFFEESHPVIRAFANFFGPVAGPILGVGVKAICGILVAAFIWPYMQNLPAFIFITGSILSFFAAWYNVWGYHYLGTCLLQF